MRLDRQDIAVTLLAAVVGANPEWAHKHRRTVVRWAFDWADDLLLFEQRERAHAELATGEAEPDADPEDWSCVPPFRTHQWDQTALRCVRCRKFNRHASRTRSYRREMQGRLRPVG